MRAEAVGNKESPPDWTHSHYISELAWSFVLLSLVFIESDSFVVLI